MPFLSAQLVGALQCLLHLLPRQAVHEIFHLAIDQAGAAGEDVPGGSGNRISFDAYTCAVELCHPVLCSDIAAIGCTFKPAEAGFGIGFAAAPFNQPCAEIKLRGVEVLPRSPHKPAPRLRVILFLAANSVRIDKSERILRVGRPALAAAS